VLRARIESELMWLYYESMLGSVFGSVMSLLAGSVTGLVLVLV
jgi:hypothetical protein